MLFYPTYFYDLHFLYSSLNFFKNRKHLVKKAAHKYVQPLPLVFRVAMNRRMILKSNQDKNDASKYGFSLSIDFPYNYLTTIFRSILTQ